MYSIKKVSELLGLPSVTIRAWENRYQVINPMRTEGGHRLYSEKDIEILQWLKEQTTQNDLKIGEAVQLLKQSTINSLDPPPVHKSFDDIKKSLYKALIEYNSQDANNIIELAFSMFEYEEVFHHILGEVLYQIGDDWENGKVTVAQEHFASQFVINRFAQFLRVLPVNDSLPKVLAFCPEEEDHHIGLMLFSLFLRKKGNEVIYLGPNTPFDGLLDVINKKKLSIITISITNPALLVRVEEWIQALTETNANLKFVIGGKGVLGSQHMDLQSVSYLTDSDWESFYESKFL
ncbi:MerR family transcriptional regulator [Bacillus sp. B-jedd]|uniref:MerR family transcriptional regulator n=1 Tax=Bacillus sp. B-jedd TaxID=1476857 RepID=UPI0005155ED5|nr:MerR family transcriptional regulator [Bacillus sp. B-jedd]CEG29416.1 MerR family transcriptional regulator [Bacillus sp. B-jedd]